MQKLFTILLLIMVFSCDYKRFNSDEWINWKESESNMHDRYMMAEDLLRTGLLIGKDTFEIKMLLGEPEQRWSNSFYYNTGPCKDQLFFGIDYSILDINIQGDIATNAKISCH